MSRVCAASGVALSILIVALTGASTASQEPHGAASQQQAPESRVIDGSREPDKLPEAVVWETAFAALHDLTGGKTDAADPEVWEFVKNNLYISTKDAAILLAGVARVRSTHQHLESQLDVAFQNDDDGEVVRLKREIDRAILESRDRILGSMSPRGAKALHRFVALLRRSMKVETQQSPSK